MGGTGGVEYLVTLSFGDKLLSFVVAGCLWLFQSPFVCLSLSKHGYQHRIYAVLVFLLFVIDHSTRRMTTFYEQQNFYNKCLGS